MEEKGSKGKILQVRMGINPNSSGHGILWGALFFMPYSLLSFILLGGLEKELETGLREYREEVMAWKKRDMVLISLLWFLIWLVFSVCWGAFLTVITGSFPYVFTVFAVVVTFLIPCLVYTSRQHLLKKMTGYVAKMALMGAVVATFVAALFWRPELPAVPFLMGYLFFCALAVVLSGFLLKLAGVFKKIDLARAGFVYLILGMVLLLPVPPISPNSYNPVSLFFPVWGWGIPSLASIYSLIRIKGVPDESTENPL